MRRLKAAEVVALCDWGADKHPLDRAAALLCAVTGRPWDEVVDLPVGRRDRLLLEVREATFGPRLDLRSACSRCGASVELTCRVDDLRVQAPDPAGHLERGDVVLRYRLPTSRDLARVVAQDPARARRELLASCVVGAWSGGAAVTADALPAGAVEALAARLEAEDPLANLQLVVACPCGGATRVTLDPAELLWSELEAHARRLLRQVHTLAGAYGWTEAEVLALGSRRRSDYVAMVHGG